jgi:hypothetical protein
MKNHLFAALLLTCSFAVQAKTRMVAESRYIYNDQVNTYTFNDSVAYTYGWGRGGAVDEEMNYNTATTYANTALGVRGVNRVAQLFNDRDSISTRVFLHPDGISWDSTWYITHNYNAAGNILADTAYHRVNGSWQASMLILNTYTSSAIVSKLTLLRNTQNTDWDSVERTTYIYNSAGKLVEDITENRFANTFIKVYRNLYTYNNDNQCTYKAYKYVADPTLPTWTDGDETAFAYNTNHDLSFQYELSHNPNTGLLDSISMVANTYNIDHKIIKQIFSQKTTGLWVLTDNFSYTYNADKHRTSFNIMKWDGNSWSPNAGSIAITYYYEYYTPTNILTQSPNAPQLQLYPVPAGNTLYLQLTEEIQQLHTVNITDMQGRQVMHQTYFGNTTQAVDISTLPAGIYNLSLLSTKGGLQRSKFTIVK